MARLPSALLAFALAATPLQVDAASPAELDMPPTEVRAEAVDCIPGDEFAQLSIAKPLVTDHGFEMTFHETHYEENKLDESRENWAAGFVVVARKDDPGSAKVFRMWSSREYILVLDPGYSLRVSGETSAATLSFKTWRYACGGKCPPETHNIAVNAEGEIIFDGEIVDVFRGQDDANDNQ